MSNLLRNKCAHLITFKNYFTSQTRKPSITNSKNLKNRIIKSKKASNSTRMASEMGIDDPAQIYDYLLVLDFEATCDQPVTPNPQEIIEFPVLKVDTKQFAVKDTFHQYVQPVVHKILTPFCTQLTGITQQMIENKPILQDTLKTFDQWLKNTGGLRLGDQNEALNFRFITCGDWDLIKMLPGQCKTFNLPYPNYFREWINLKKAYCEHTHHFPRGMTTMLEQLNLALDGRHHSGIDDCKNIAKIVKELGSRGYVFKTTTKLK